MLPGVGASEMIVVVVVALMLMGPRDLSLMMRKLGRFTGKMRAMAWEFRQSFEEIGRQAELDELRKEVEALKKHSGLDAMASEMRDLDREIGAGVAAAASPAVQPAAQPHADGSASADAAPTGEAPPVATTEPAAADAVAEGPGAPERAQNTIGAGFAPPSGVRVRDAGA